MGLLEMLGLGGPRPKGRGGFGRMTQDNLEADEATEGRLEPPTAALMDGAPPSSASGRHVPHSRGAAEVSAGHAVGHGATEADATHLPG